MAVPARTAEERRDASARAVVARRRRAQVSNALKAGELTMAELLALATDDDAVAAMRVRSALESLPRMGPGRAATVMERLRISASRRLRGLGSTQRAALLELTDPHNAASPHTAPRSTVSTVPRRPDGRGR
jgi:hypothetical protein